MHVPASLLVAISKIVGLKRWVGEGEGEGEVHQGSHPIFLSITRTPIFDIPVSVGAAIKHNSLIKRRNYLQPRQACLDAIIDR